MRSKLSVMLTVLLCGGVLTACGNNDNSSKSSNSEMTVTSESMAETVSSEELTVSSEISEPEQKRYIITERTPQELFKALSFQNDEAVVWAERSEDITEVCEDGYVSFAPESGIANVYAEMKDGYCVSARCSLRAEEDDRDDAGKVIGDFLYAVFPEYEADDLDRVRDEVLQWTDRTKDSPTDEECREFGIGESSVTVCCLPENDETIDLDIRVGF